MQIAKMHVLMHTLTGVQTVVSSKPLTALAGVILASSSIEAEVVTTLCPSQNLTIHCREIFKSI